ncbi:MAG TPA: sialidase family protein, partial [Terriglobia bacterium]|nr:sialidase family protein [Terriglobia bacterium]
MRNIVALFRNICADAFNRKQGASKKSRHRHFILERLETRVLLSSDLLASSSWIDQPEPSSGSEVLRPYEGEDEVTIPSVSVVLEPELGPGTNLAVGLVGNEPIVAVNPLNPNNVVVANFNSGSQTMRISLDGGLTFPIVRNAVLVPGQTFFQGDDSLAFDSAGRLFWSYLSGGTPTGPNVNVVQVNPATGAIVGSPTLVGITSLDKEWLAADANPLSPFADNLYVVWHDFAQLNAPVRFARSTDQGVTWTTLPGNLSGAGEGFTWPSEVTVAPDGDVFVAWHTNTGATAGEVRMRRSTDGGLTFGPEIIPFPAGTAATTTNSGTGLANKVNGLHVWLQGSMQPRILTDPARPGNIYVVCVDDPDTFLPTNDPSDIVIARSTDDGVTWTRSTISQGLYGDAEFMPSASINADGDITVTWYDNRRHLTVADSLGGTHFLLDLFAANSFDGGLTFTNPFQVNDPANAFDPERGAPDRFGNHTLRIGEYNGVALVDSTAYAVWTGNSATGQQIYYDRYFTGLTVASTAPAIGSVVSTQPTTFTVNVSSPIIPETAQASDFKVNGIPADSVSYIPGTTALSFSFGSTPVIAQGLQTMHIDAGAFARDFDGDLVSPFDGTFRYDSVLLQVTSTAPPVGGIFTLPAPFTYDVSFNEAVDPASVQASDLLLTGISGAMVSAVTVLPGNTSARFTLTGITGEGTLTASILAGAFTDVFGNPGAAFSGTYPVDVSTAPFPTPLAAKNPIGSLIYDPSQPGSIGFVGDVDTFTLNVDPNQTISLILTPTAPFFQPRIELFDPNNDSQGFASALAAGQIASIQTSLASLGGVYSFAVSGVGSSIGSYTLQVILNSAFELEGKVPGVTNDTLSSEGLTLNAVDSGWITAQGVHTTTNNNYAVGQSLFAPFPPPPPPVPPPVLTEFRNYFTFSLPAATPAIVGAELRLFNPSAGYNSPDPTETYSLYDVVSFTAADLDVNRASENQTGKDIHTDLGDGTVYGTRDVSPADNGTTVVIPLNSDALGALNAAIGSTISFGGAITTLAGTAPQIMFGGTIATPGTVQLALQTATPVINAQDINSSFVTLSTPQASAQRGAVLGQTDLPTSYTATAVPFVFEDISATGTVLAPLTNQDNAAVTILGFSFPLYGVVNTNVSVSSNGLLTFGGANTSGINSDLTLSPAQAAVSPFWDDLHTGGGVVGSNVLFQIIGTGADRHLTVQWNKVRYQSGGTAGDTITFQAQLYADGRIRFNYQDLVSVGAAGNNGASATVGIKGAGAQGSNRLLLAFNNGPNSFVESGKSTLITPSAPGPDYYAFTLNAGETATLAATVLAAGNLTVELRDSSDAVLATGVGGSANLTSVINDFTAAVGGTYFARISGGDGITSLPYSLVVTRNAELDRENNSTAASAQSLDGNQGALGYAVGGGFPTLYGSTRA